MCEEGLGGGGGDGGGQIVLTPITATAWRFSYLGCCSHSLIFRTYGTAFCIIVY